jgi:hypothetical protein
VPTDNDSTSVLVDELAAGAGWTGDKRTADRRDGSILEGAVWRGI